MRHFKAATLALALAFVGPANAQEYRAFIRTPQAISPSRLEDQCLGEPRNTQEPKEAFASCMAVIQTVLDVDILTEYSGGSTRGYCIPPGTRYSTIVQAYLAYVDNHRDQVLAVQVLRGALRSTFPCSPSAPR